MSETPLTDAAVARGHINPAMTEYVPASLSRRLEAENERLRSAIEAGERALQEAAADMVGAAADPETVAEPLRRAADARIAMRTALLRPDASWSDLDRENDKLRRLLSELLAHFEERDRGDGNAPGHAHSVPGVWDRDNGDMAGQPCAWCALWAEAKATMLTPRAASTTP